jgi:hypothetical protein
MIKVEPYPLIDTRFIKYLLRMGSLVAYGVGMHRFNKAPCFRKNLGMLGAEFCHRSNGCAGVMSSTGDDFAVPA